jgi:hypothetical protein
LVSAIIDNLQIPERWKHRNHRGVKYALKDSGEIIEILGERAEYLTECYNAIETQFMSHFQYGGFDETPDYEALIDELDQIVSLCKEITLEVTKSLGEGGI